MSGKRINDEPHRNRTIGLIAPFPPPLGGMAIQALKLERNLQLEGFNIVPLPTNPAFPRLLGCLDDLRFIRTFARSALLLRRIYESCRHTDTFYFLTGFFNFFFWVTLPVLLLLKSRGKRVILSARGGEGGLFFERYSCIVKPVLELASAITVPSGFLQQEFLNKLGIHTVIVPNIADLEQFTFRDRTVFRPHFLVTRHLEEIYGIDSVIRAFKLIHSKYPSSSLTIAGDGTQKPVLKELVTALALDKSVSFLGPVAHAQLPNLYDSHDILLNGSRVDNLPGAILEAYASGLLVVSTRAGGIPFLVEHEKTGLLADVDDVESIARMAIDSLEAPARSQAMCHEALKVARTYSWEKVRKVLIPILSRKDLL